jgi:hypothetical protein
MTALQEAGQLDALTVCRMLLAAPRLARVPASFWQLLMQYILFLVPQWRQQVTGQNAHCYLAFRIAFCTIPLSTVLACMHGTAWCIYP